MYTRMSENVLNLEFLWLPRVEDIAEIDSIINSREPDCNFKPTGPILKLKKDLSNFCGFPIFINDCKKRIEFPNSAEQGIQKRSKTEHALFYLEFLFNVFCTVKLEKSKEYDLKRFVNLFFSVKHGKLVPELYLKYDPSVFDVKATINTENKEKEISSFSLGNFVGLNTFCERFHSKKTINDAGYKITQNRLVVLHDYKKMLFYFVVGKICRVKQRNATTHLLHKLEIPYSSLHSVVISKNEGLTVFIRVLQPPLMYSVIQLEEEECDYTSFHELSYNTKWFRALNLFEDCPSYLRKEFTMNTVLKLDFQKEEYDCFFHLMTHCKNVQIIFAPVSIVRLPSHQKEFKINLENFECYYALQCLLTHSYEINDQLMVREETEAVKKFLQEKSKENPIALSEAMYLIFEAIIKGNVLIFLSCLKMLYERLQLKSTRAAVEDFSSKAPQPKHLLLIKRAIITPTHFLLLPPQPTLKSRALRDCDPNYSLRLSIKDVNMDTLNFSIKGFGPEMAQRYNDFFNKYYREHLLNGIQIGNRCYKYVGSSTSQLKGHGLWFYAKDGNQKTSDDLRKEFGKLEKIRNVPKYMARMGQTFSQSMGHIKVPQSWTNVKDPEEDITGGQKEYLDLSDATEKKRKFMTEVEKGGEESDDQEKDLKKADPYTFSDGIGRISNELAKEVYKALDVEDLKPSAMQIRYAGCKGMLVVDPKLKGKQIMFRKSMRKFDSEHDSLEILKFSEKRSAFLNRPFVTILEQLGVGKEVFLQLQKEMIQNHITSMFHETAACSFLHRHSLLRFDYQTMYSAGFRFTEDPLYRSMIYALFQKQIELLKKKANIEIPVDKGRSMFGVIDETFTLEYGEVFVQYSDWDTNKPILVKGTVVVTKNPCMHPGDVRKFQAVDKEGLRHIVDCIVFPAKGPRPHPDEMAGSDLDGDEYHVMWIEDLIFPKDNQAPMNFAIKEKKEDLGRDVEISDELDHFCDYIFNDKVGIIASAHLVWADQDPNGIFSEVCLRLSKQYSIALDFAKSGIPVVQKHNDSPFKYPDFMEKLDEKRSYLSKQALGMLFRGCKRLELGLETEKNEIDYKIDNALRHEDWEKKYKKSALRLYKKYCDKIEFYLRTYGFENEGQLLAGALVNPPKYYQNRHDMDNLMALLEFEVQFIFKDLERRFFEEFGGKPKDGVYTDDMLQKASAWYMVSYSKSEDVGSRFFGMPWAVDKVLIELKRRNRNLSSPALIQSKTILEEIVDKSVSKHFLLMSPETESEEIYENRHQVLDVAQKILSRWVKSQRDYFSDPDIKKVEKCISKEFNSITSAIVERDVRYIDKLKEEGKIKKAISPCYQVIETMLHIAKIGAQRPQFSLSDIRQEVGLLAWMTLIKLSCTYNPQYLGIPNEAGQYAKPVFYKPQENIVDTLQLPLFDKKDESNMKFSRAVTHDYQEVREYLMQQTKVKDIDIRFENLRDDTQVGRITVQGTRYSIERLKDIVVMKEFFDAVAERKPLSYYLST